MHYLITHHVQFQPQLVSLWFTTFTCILCIYCIQYRFHPDPFSPTNQAATIKQAPSNHSPLTNNYFFSQLVSLRTTRTHLPGIRRRHLPGCLPCARQRPRWAQLSISKGSASAAVFSQKAPFLGGVYAGKGWDHGAIPP